MSVKRAAFCGSAAGRGRGHEGAGIDIAHGDNAAERRGNLRKSKQGLSALGVGIGGFQRPARLIHCHRQHEIRRFLLSGGQALQLDFGDLRVRLVALEIRGQFGHFELGQQIALLHGISFIHRDGRNISGHLRVKRRFQIGADRAGKRNIADDFTALRLDDFDSDRGLAFDGKAESTIPQRKGCKGLI